jgi:hypothetical protein
VELARAVFPYFAIVDVKAFLGLGHPVWLVGPRFRDEVYLEAGFAKDLEGLDRSADE